MRQVHIVMGLLQQGDDYLLQLRNGDARIGAAGLVGCFGGKVNADEALEDAVARELGEETTCTIEPTQWKLLGKVKVLSDHLHEPVEVHATAFHHLLGKDADVVAKEGELIRWTLEAVMERIEQLTPATRAMFMELLQGEAR